MYKSFITLLGLVLCMSSMQAQQSSLVRLLQKVEANNKSLEAYKSSIAAKTLLFESGNKLPNPQAAVYYLPFGQHNTGDYSEFQVSQSLEFPSVYATRSTLIDERKKRLEYQYQELRQDILLQAQKLGLEMIYLHKQRALVEKRVNQAQKVYRQVQTLFDKDQAGILDLNKAKIVWLDQQFLGEDLKTRTKKVKQELQSLNGGHELRLQWDKYPQAIQIPSADSLWKERMKQDAQIALLKQEEAIAKQALRVERNQLLPDITAGYNYQGVAGSNYSGFYGGISIPLWSGRSKVKMAKAQINYKRQHQSDVLNSLKSKYLSQLQRYQLLLHKFKEYQKTMEGLNSEMLLKKSYELGEISFMEYYSEISFYRDAQNRMLEIEKELQQLRAELFKYRL